MLISNLHPDSRALTVQLGNGSFKLLLHNKNDFKLNSDFSTVTKTYGHEETGSMPRLLASGGWWMERDWSEKVCFEDQCHDSIRLGLVM